jgi:DnaA-homolog protein
MHQLAFQLKASPPPSLDNFVVGQNRELLSTIGRFLLGREEVRFLYLWGLEGSGKTHLLQAVGAAWQDSGRRTSHSLSLDEADPLDDQLCVCVDGVDRLDDNEQIEFFNMYNEIRDCGGRMFVTGRQPLSGLSLRPDVLTRLGWGLVYQVFPLDDIHRAEAMVEYAKLRGFNISPEVIAFVLARHPRDLTSLVALLDGLDRYSMELKRSITIPLVKSFFESGDRA